MVAYTQCEAEVYDRNGKDLAGTRCKNTGPYDGLCYNHRRYPQRRRVWP